MPSYRFCRPDTIPLLVEALNACWRPHFPDEPEMTVERFRREMRELDVWPSSSMVVLDGDTPIAVIIGTKREHEILIHRLAVAPGHERQGHGSHLVMSLSHKLAVLGPPKLAAEVPTDNEAALALFASLDFHRDGTLTDWLVSGFPARDEGRGARDEGSDPDAGSETWEEVSTAELLPRLPPIALSWYRAPRTLEQAAQRLQGLSREDAWVILDPEAVPPHALAFVGATEALAALLTDVAAARGGSLLLPRYAEPEITADLARALPLRAARRYDRLITTATPA